MVSFSSTSVVVVVLVGGLFELVSWPCSRTKSRGDRSGLLAGHGWLVGG